MTEEQVRSIAMRTVKTILEKELSAWHKERDALKAQVNDLRNDLHRQLKLRSVLEGKLDKFIGALASEDVSPAKNICWICKKKIDGTGVECGDSMVHRNCQPLPAIKGTP